MNSGVVGIVSGQERRRIRPSLGDLSGKLPVLRTDFGPWVDYVVNELSSDKQAEAIIMGFNSVLDNFQLLVRESQEQQLSEMQQVCRNLVEQKIAAVEQAAEFFQEQIRELREKLVRDPLTGLLHFKEFKNRLALFLTIEKRVQSCAVGVVDLANFKKVNDEGSHILGDKALVAVARQIENSIRPNDLFARERRRSSRPQDLHARHAGDQFVFMLPNATSRKMTQKIAERFQCSLESNTPADFLEQFGHPIHADIGVVWYELEPVEARRTGGQALARALFEAADYCMYHSKKRARRMLARNGKNAGAKNVSRVYTRTARMDHEKNRLLVLGGADGNVIEATFSLDS